MAEWNPKKDGWFSGFADGEACFVIARRTDRGVGYSVRFQLGLRADDFSVLQRLQETFGGTLRVYRHPKGQSQCMWVVSAKREIAGLVAYFDSFPLRAKKARDYALWRQAVQIVCSKGSGSEELDPLVDALREVRKFDGQEPVAQSVPPQLRLVDEA